jgi:hypothetical protein
MEVTLQLQCVVRMEWYSVCLTCNGGAKYLIYPRTRRSGIINASEAGSLARALHSSTWDVRRWDKGGLYSKFTMGHGPGRWGT